MSALDERMRETMVQGTPDLQEICCYYMQKLQSLEDELAYIKAGRAEIMSCFSAPMAATLWSTLPQEILREIFARLPLPDIIRLQCLSKTWKMNLTSRDSEFKRVCAEASPKMFAMVSEGNAEGCASVQLYDVKANKWHSYMHQSGSHLSAIGKLYAGDGGLVCLVSTDTCKWGRHITVLNPLDPGRSRALPHHALPRDLELRMVQLVMDRDRRCYKVLVVGEKNNGRVVAKIFSSETGAWNGEISEGLVFGHRISCHGIPLDAVGPCAYDSVGRQLLELVDGSHPIDVHFDDSEDFDESEVFSYYAHVKDHLFVLHEETYEETDDIEGDTYESLRYCISEYRGQECKPHWVKVKVHRCKEFEHPPTSVLYKLSLYACQGFLLVKAENIEDSEAYRHVLTWLYDMATEKWQAIPPFADKAYRRSKEVMFELQWDAIP